MNSTPDDRLSRISTVSVSDLGAHAQFERYHQAARAYVLHLAKDEDATQEVLTQLLEKFLNGLQQKWPGRGRFRDYLKVVLRNAVRDYFRDDSREKARRRETLLVDPSELPDQKGDSVLNSGFASEHIARARKTLAASQRDGVFSFIVEVLIEVENGLKGEELAARLAAHTGKPYTPDNARQQKKRALECFARILAAEVASTIDPPTPEHVEAELAELKLLALVGEYLPWKQEDAHGGDTAL